jgi:phosphonate transport system substrate-binding protein
MPHRRNDLLHRPARRDAIRRAMLGLTGAALAPAARAQGAAAQAGGSPLHLALVPYLSSRALLSVYTPLREHLEGQLGRPVDMVGAGSFRALAEGARLGDPLYNMLPMHLARLALVDWGHTLLARTVSETAVRLVALRAQAAGGVPSLRGQRVLSIDPVSATSLLLRRWLAVERLEGQVELVHVPNMNSATIQLQRGEAAAVAVIWLPGELGALRQDEVAVLATLGGVQACFTAHPRSVPEERKALQQALLGYRQAAAPGQAPSLWFTEGAPRDLEPFDALAADARRLLASAPAAR